MKLRKLEKKDAPYMLEWMHDPEVVEYLRADFASKTLTDCLAFISDAQDTTESLHMAIVDDSDEYMGTVSLKHITEHTAEFGITVRKCAMGYGYAQYGMQKIIEMGANDLELKEIYWCVSPFNRRALRFYNRQMYERCPAPAVHSYYSTNELNSLIWYHVTCG